MAWEGKEWLLDPWLVPASLLLLACSWGPAAPAGAWLSRGSEGEVGWGPGSEDVTWAPAFA